MTPSKQISKFFPIFTPQNWSRSLPFNMLLCHPKGHNYVTCHFSLPMHWWDNTLTKSVDRQTVKHWWSQYPMGTKGRVVIRRCEESPDWLFHLVCVWLWMLQPVTMHTLPRTNSSLLQLTWVLIFVGVIIKFTVQTSNAQLSEVYDHQRVPPPPRVPYQHDTLQLWVHYSLLLTQRIMCNHLPYTLIYKSLLETAFVPEQFSYVGLTLFYPTKSVIAV